MSMYRAQSCLLLPQEWAKNYYQLKDDSLDPDFIQLFWFSVTHIDLSKECG